MFFSQIHFLHSAKRHLVSLLLVLLLYSEPKAAVTETNFTIDPPNIAPVSPAYQTENESRAEELIAPPTPTSPSFLRPLHRCPRLPYSDSDLLFAVCIIVASRILVCGCVLAALMRRASLLQYVQYRTTGPREPDICTDAGRETLGMGRGYGAETPVQSKPICLPLPTFETPLQHIKPTTHENNQTLTRKYYTIRYMHLTEEAELTRFSRLLPLFSSNASST